MYVFVMADVEGNAVANSRIVARVLAVVATPLREQDFWGG
jgi:hypothetical protein